MLFDDDAVLAITCQILPIGAPISATASRFTHFLDESRPPCGTPRRAMIGSMTPAERASAVAFALKNCALENMTPGPETMRAAVAYERGAIDISRLMAIADGESVSSSGRNHHADAAAKDAEADHASSLFARNVLLPAHGWRATGDLAELTAIHTILFASVFDDAGTLRTVNAPRENGSGQANTEPFFPAQLIETGAANIAMELAERRNLACLDRIDFVRHLAAIHDELGYLHPFAGGNAMTLRVFVSRLAHDAGWDLDWSPVTREAYQAAKYKAYRGDTHAFERIFAAAVRPANPTRVFLIAGWEQGPAH